MALQLFTRKEIAYRRIKKDILNRKWRPGSKIVERGLSRMFNMSRIPIREALSRLEKEGLVVQVPNWGTYIRKADEKEVMEMYEVREALEGGAARLAASRATGEDLDELVQIVEEMEKTAAKKNKKSLHAFEEADNRFHVTLVKTSHNSKLIELASLCHLRAEEIPRLVSEESAETERQRLLEEHRQIVECLSAKKALTAEKLVRRHIFGAKKKVERFFRKKRNERE